MTNQGTSEKGEKVKVQYRKSRTERLNREESESNKIGGEKKRQLTPAVGAP